MLSSQLFQLLQAFELVGIHNKFVVCLLSRQYGVLPLADRYSLARLHLRVRNQVLVAPAIGSIQSFLGKLLGLVLSGSKWCSCCWDIGALSLRSFFDVSCKDILIVVRIS
jgi:hypothetical protein